MLDKGPGDCWCCHQVLTPCWVSGRAHQGSKGWEGATWVAVDRVRAPARLGGHERVRSQKPLLCPASHSVPTVAALLYCKPCARTWTHTPHMHVLANATTPRSPTPAAGTTRRVPRTCAAAPLPSPTPSRMHCRRWGRRPRAPRWAPRPRTQPRRRSIECTTTSSGGRLMYHCAADDVPLYCCAAVVLL